jgi:predicted DNA-binding ribbon-helix-helix protein
MSSPTPAQNKGGHLKSTIAKRSIVIAGRKTSVSLETQFGQCLREIADARRVPVSTVVADIEADPARGNLSSAIRTFVLHKVREAAARRANNPKDLAGIWLSQISSEIS